MTIRVLLTGASGFIGSHCIQPLLDKDLELHCVSSRERASTSGEIWHRADLLNESEIKVLLEKVLPTHLLHLAWFAEPGTVNDTRNLLWAKAGLALVHAFGECGGKRLLIGGTCLEYDWNHGYCSEARTPRVNESLYGCCKNSLFEMASRYASIIHLSFAWARLFFLYGPRENPVRLVPHVINSLLAGEAARCSSGEQIRDYMYVQDAANGLVNLLVSDAQGDFNIASNSPICLRQIVEMVGEKMGRSELIEFGAVAKRENDAPLVVADTRKIFTTIGWQPSVNLDSGLDQTIQWWKNELRE